MLFLQNRNLLKGKPVEPHGHIQLLRCQINLSFGTELGSTATRFCPHQTKLLIPELHLCPQAVERLSFKAP
jgi:hypothetical protein